VAAVSEAAAGSGDTAKVALFALESVHAALENAAHLIHNLVFVYLVLGAPLPHVSLLSMGSY
jgi:hypothetical protein